MFTFKKQKMKNLIQCLLLCFCVLSGVPLSAQVFNMSTGISNVNSSMLAVGALDDTWTVAMPGAPNTFLTTTCAANTYWQCSPNVRWLYPTGQNPLNCIMGDYYFKTTIDLQCPVSDAQFVFAHIGADDVIQDIQINGNPTHPVNWSFNYWGVNVNLPIPGSEFQIGTNTILVHVYNWGSGPGATTQFGLEIEGSLNITPAAPNAAFTLTSNGTNVQATSTASGNHSWDVYSSPNGNVGSYTYLATYTTQNLNFPATAPCYFIQHTVTSVCGSVCAAQSVCNLNCKKPCPIPAPTNLAVTYAGSVLPAPPSGPYKFSWNPVAGATSYVIDIIWNDPTCCRNDLLVSTVSIPVTTNSYTMSIPTNCFSWTVKALCADGSPVTSARKCEQISSGPGNPPPSGKAAPGGARSAHDLISIFPNPAFSSVSFAIETAEETAFQVTVTDINGKSVKTFEQMNTTGKKANITWNTTSLSKGIYLVKITTAASDQAITKKLVIE